MPEILSSSAGIENHGANLSGTEIPPPPSGLSRRTALAGLLAAYASAALAGSGCRGESGEKATPDTDTSRTPPPTPPESEVPAFPGTTEIDSSIPMPTSEIIDMPYEFPVPADLEGVMDPEEFSEKAKIAASAIARYVEETLMPELRQAGEQGLESDQAILRAIGVFPAILVDAVPEFEPSLAAFRPQAAAKGDRQSDWMSYLKPFLEAGGYFFEVEEREHFRMSFCPILGTQHVRVSDGSAEYEVPLLRMGKDKIESPFSGRRRDIAGSMSAEVAHMYLFEDAVEPMLQGILARGKPEWPRFKSPISSAEDLERTKEMFRKNIIHHEAVHAFLARKFPTIASIANRRMRVKISTHVEFIRQDKEGKPIAYKHRVAGRFPPALIQELAAVGAELAFSSIAGPWEHFSFFQTGGGKDQLYVLARRILAIATMWMAPVSPMHDLPSWEEHSSGRVTSEDIGEVIGNEPYTQADTQAVGEVMYRLAYDFFRKIEEALDK